MNKRIVIVNSRRIVHAGIGIPNVLPLLDHMAKHKIQKSHFLPFDFRNTIKNHTVIDTLSFKTR